MKIRPVKTEEDYRATLSEIESLMSAVPGSPEGEWLDVLVTLVEAYERQHFLLDLEQAREAGEFWTA
jgi:HTH-type transcriptional regulator / antitoxin HigA